MSIPVLYFLFLPILAADENDSLLAATGDRVTHGAFRKALVLNGSLVSPSSEKFLVPRSNSWELKLEWMIPEGTLVKVGDVVVRFDNSSLVNANLDKEDELFLKQEERFQKATQVEDELLTARLRIKEAGINLEKARVDAGIPAELQEMRKYQESQLALTKAQKEVKRAEKDYETLEQNKKAELAILDLTIENIQAEVSRNNRMIAAMAMTAETSGIAVYEEHPWEGRTIVIGDVVRPGWSVMRIPEPQNMQVEAWAGETDMGLLQPQQTAQFFLDAYPKRAFTGKVISVSNRGVIKKDFGKAPWFEISLDLEMVDPQIMKPGMSVRTEILISEHQDALLIPLAMVGFHNNAFFIQPRGQAPQQVEPLGFNEFFMALENGTEEGTRLEPVRLEDE